MYLCPNSGQVEVETHARAPVADLIQRRVCRPTTPVQRRRGTVLRYLGAAGVSAAPGRPPAALRSGQLPRLSARAGVRTGEPGRNGRGARAGDERGDLLLSP